MNTLTDSQQQVLDRGLAAFDAASGRRRTRRRLVRGCGAALVVAVCGVVATRMREDAPPPLPAYVEIIANDTQLTGELALANACEKIDRHEGRLLVIECVLPPEPRS
jgi:hypothetical protein